MHIELCELISGERADLCTLGNGTVGAFDRFLDRLDEGQQVPLLCLLNRIARNGTVDNPDLFCNVPGCVGLFRVSIAGVELACFRDGRKLVICEYVQGRLTHQLHAQAQFSHSQYLAYRHQQGGRENEK